MEGVGWVKREDCPLDKRGYFAVMTDKGFKAIAKAAPDHVESVRSRLLDHLSVKDQEEISRIFDRVTNKLRGQYLAEDK
jgi:DNA-binding MarR family transcriptional regulator